jgi:hypothetical protein
MATGKSRIVLAALEEEIERKAAAFKKACAD